MKDFEVRRSKIAGSGIFALRDVAKGDRVFKLIGERISEREAVDRIARGEVAFDDPLQVGSRTYLILDDFSRCINHSCDPNVAVGDRGMLRAMRDIKKGDELAFDYSAVVGIENEGWEMPCKCGAGSCRSVISYWGSIPRKVRTRYRALGGFPTFILKQMEQP